jgi:hypothetical protein
MVEKGKGRKDVTRYLLMVGILKNRKFVYLQMVFHHWNLREVDCGDDVELARSRLANHNLGTAEIKQSVGWGKKMKKRKEKQLSLFPQ